MSYKITSISPLSLIVRFIRKRLREIPQSADIKVPDSLCFGATEKDKQIIQSTFSENIRFGGGRFKLN